MNYRQGFDNPFNHNQIQITEEISIACTCTCMLFIIGQGIIIHQNQAVPVGLQSLVSTSSLSCPPQPSPPQPPAQDGLGSEHQGINT